MVLGLREEFKEIVGVWGQVSKWCKDRQQCGVQTPGGKV